MVGEIMTIQKALKWFEKRTYMDCGDCVKSHDFTCSGADYGRCAAYRVAINALRAVVDNERRNENG